MGLAVIDPKDLESAYDQAWLGENHAGMILVEEGLFVRGEDGKITVHGFDSEGNSFPLSPEDQKRQIEALYIRIGKGRVNGK